MLILAPNDMPVVTLAAIAAQMGYAVQSAGNALKLVPFGPPRQCDDVTVVVMGSVDGSIKDTPGVIIVEHIEYRAEPVTGEIVFPPDESTEDELITAACHRVAAATRAHA